MKLLRPKEEVLKHFPNATHEYIPGIWHGEPHGINFNNPPYNYGWHAETAYGSWSKAYKWIKNQITISGNLKSCGGKDG